MIDDTHQNNHTHIDLVSWPDNLGCAGTPSY